MIVAVLLIASIGALLIFGAVQKSNQQVRSLSQGFLLTYIVMVLPLIAGELYFRYAYADPRMEFALTGGNWEQRYVQKNSYGWRDREWTEAELSQRTVIFAVGDSFTEGWGINNPADRYTDVLGSLLGDSYAVVNMGFRGVATLHQVEAVQNYPYQPPDVIIWQYFINDIDVAAKSNGMTWEQKQIDPPAIAQESYLASFVFWRLNEYQLNVNYDGKSQWDYFYEAYDNPYIWDIHRQEIDRMIDYAESADARLILVIFPHMIDPVGSIPYVDRVAQYVESRGHTDILKLFDAAAAWKLEDRIVAPYDSHASAAFNRYVGETLYEQFFR
jgi:lysophospholipase L1-like esterase